MQIHPKERQEPSRCRQRTLLGSLLAIALVAAVRPAPGVMASEESRLLGRLRGVEMLRWVRDLCRPEFAGRRAGTPGVEKAVETMAARFKRIGLEEVSGASGYRQPFTMSYSLLRSRWDRQAKLADPKGSVQLAVSYPDFPPRAFAFQGPAVFLRYGIHRPDRQWDDFDGVDLRGKLAVFWQDAPPGVSQPLETRCEAAARRGAAGCVVITRTRLREDVEGATDRGIGGFLSGFPVIQLRRDSATRLFKAPVPAPLLRIARRSPPADRTDQGKLLTPLADDAPAVVPPRDGGLGRGLGKVWLRIPASIDPARRVANVVGAWRGSDPVLRNDWVILSAHLDHLGTAPNGVYHGADDDASGVAVVTAVAEAMVREGLRPRRSVLFALWNGEECGLLGSRHYVKDPLVPLERTVGVLQLDMVGVGETSAFLTSARRNPAPLFASFEGAAKGLDLRLPADKVTGVSDHIPFMRAGVPALVITTAGSHPHYHTIGDRPERIRPEALENCARLMAVSVWRLADEPPPVTMASRLRRSTSLK